MSEAAHPVRLGSTRLRWAKGLALLVMAVSMFHSVIHGLSSLPFDKGFSRLGLRPSAAVSEGYTQVEQLQPGGAAAAAGINIGDWVRFDRPADALRLQVRPGETFGVSVRHGDAARHVTLTAPPSRANPLRIESLISAATYLLIASAGGLITVRSRRVSGVALGAALSAMGMLGTYTQLWENHPAVQLLLQTLYQVVMFGAPVGLLGFALLMRRETTGRPVTRPWRIAVGVYAGLQAASVVQSVFVSVTFVAFPFVGDGFLAGALLQWAGYLATFLVLGFGFREATGEDRTRFGFLLLALSLMFVGGTGIGMVINMTGNDFSFANPLAIASDVLTIAGLAAFLYAMLRHRVVDLGFAVNRTLVYGILSTVLLFAFWFFEWSLEEIIPAETREANILISAGIAFLIFLTFHHVRDWVEKAIENVFFRAWRDNEARLRRFLKDASYITRIASLRTAAVAEFRRFTGGAEVALYGVEPDGAVLREGAVSGLGDRIEPDTPALVRLRADREPLDGDLAGPLGAELMLPIVQRSDVIGVFVLGAKPSGEPYRPDERALLADAAHRIGLDLHALEIERLESRVGELDAQLRLAMQGRPSAA
jgi:hypothetical protein